MVYLLIGLAGALGAMLRYMVGITLWTDSIFPFATLTVNLLGSFLLAWLTTALFKRISISPMLASAIGTGFVGSFTTFSTLSVETVEMMTNGHAILAILYVAISIIGGMFMSRIGFKVSREGEGI
ncbi:fluoride efflux transporter FluC [Aquibacillus sediminis]|uniref:fluoride efflux transporter FluC n=1 Tax=Aquibacillus sediminis TaxID=2574734 RepID=UPI0011091A2C|nr:CrcB family protein [Aquibacillus sediminis]